MKPSAPSVAALANHVGSHLGEACGSIELVADRRGSTVYRLQFPTRDVALKLASRNTDNEGVREAEHLARREATVLARLHDFAPGYLIDSGDLNNDGSWLNAVKLGRAPGCRHSAWAWHEWLGVSAVENHK